MLAAVFHSPNNMTLQQVPITTTQLTLKVNACAVCGYDVRVYRHGHRKVSPPVILGHELCGEIQSEVKVNGTTVKKGSRVALCPLLPCLSCRYCQSNDFNLCMNLREIGSTSNGGFAQYVTIPEQITTIGGLVPVPKELTDEEAALLEPLACSLNSFSRMAPLPSSASAVIIGDGPMALLHLQLLKRLSSSKVAIVGRIQQRMEKATAMGADAVFDYSKGTVAEILDFSGACQGAGAIVIATSNPAAFEFAIKIAAKNSKINLFAGMPGNQKFKLDANWIHYNQISITGSFSSTPALLADAAKLAGQKIIDLNAIVTHKYPLEEIEKAINVTENYHGLRTVITKF